MNTTYDTIILGLGAMGSAAAFQLARRGQRVLGIEQFAAAHTLGSSHGQSRIIRQAYFEDPAYVPLLLRAYELWAELEQASGQQLLLITGGLMLGEAESTVVAGSLRSAQQHGLAYELLGAADIRRRWPALQPTATTIGLYETMGGLLYPEAAIKAHLHGAASAGADLHFNEPVHTWQASATGDGVVVRTATGNYQAARLIIAAGAWASQLVNDPAGQGFSLPLRVQRNVLYWFAPQGGQADFLPDRFPIYIWKGANDLAFYGFPALDGAPGGVKVAFHGHGPLCTPDAVDRQVQPHEVAAIRAALAERIPSLAQGELLATATCLYTLTPDEHFVIGMHPQHPQVVIASPCSGHGFKFASVVGEILADLAANGATRHPIGLFAPTRFAP